MVTSYMYVKLGIVGVFRQTVGYKLHALTKSWMHRKSRNVLCTAYTCDRVGPKSHFLLIRGDRMLHKEKLGGTWPKCHPCMYTLYDNIDFLFHSYNESTSYEK